MKKFAIKFIIFLLPFAVILGPILSILIVSGEAMPVGAVVRMQNQKRFPILYGPAYGNPVFYYKLQSVIDRNPDIMALGTSRVMQFRSKFFTDKYLFYNAGGGISRITHFNKFLARIPSGKEPKIMIVGLDQYFFNINFDSLAEDGVEQWLSDDGSLVDVTRKNYNQIKKDFESKYSVSQVFTQNDKFFGIGLNARINKNGFRNDGSYYYGSFINDQLKSNNIKPNFKESFERISNGHRRFEYGQTISNGAILELKEFLQNCKDRNIYVVGFIPPYAHAVYEKLKETNNYQYMFQLESTLRPIFEQCGYSLFDFSDISSVGASDIETIDGFHGSEKAYLRLFIKMAEQDRNLKKYTDIEYLKTKLKESDSPYDVFYYEF